MKTLAFNANWYILLDQLGWNVIDRNIINKMLLNVCKVHIFWVFEITYHSQKKGWRLLHIFEAYSEYTNFSNEYSFQLSRIEINLWTRNLGPFETNTWKINRIHLPRTGTNKFHIFSSNLIYLYFVICLVLLHLAVPHQSSHLWRFQQRMEQCNL